MDAPPAAQNEVSAAGPGAKPAVPRKPGKPAPESDVGRGTHVRDMIRRLQEKEQPNGSAKPIFIKMGGKAGKAAAAAEKEEASNQTLEDLKAIDEDIEKLRKQIEERDKIISALREAAEAKDKKLDHLLVENSKLRSDGKLDLDASPEPGRAASSSPSSPPLCSGELCWTDSFVNKNYHEPVYARLLDDHAALQKTYDDLRTQLETKGKEFERLKAETEAESRGSDAETKAGENAINLIMAEQIRVLKEREAQLIWEAEELREQNDLMEFRILELEECRKEFLDKEMAEGGKHRAEKIVWRERDFEEVSDSGVMSLPTSEDLTSDSELGDAIRNYSPLGAATSLSPLAPETSTSEPPQKKSLRSSECLQESGIFVDSEPPSECAAPAGKHSKGCQTESLLDRTLLDIIDSSCDLFLSKNPGYLDPKSSDDLSTEISKLSVIQKRIQQQKTHLPAGKGPHTVFACPHSKSVLFYEERLTQLEDKLKIYESSGDAKDVLLARRLQKEVELAHRVKELTDKVASLEASNRKLEEEKCEFEEAENDTRFQCQRLEIRLQELIDKNTELELEVERHKVIMNEERRRERKKGSLEGLISKYEQRNFELEEKDVETRRRLTMIESAMPAIVAWNLYKMSQNPEFVHSIPPVGVNSESVVRDKSFQVSDPTMIQRLEEIMVDQRRLRKDCERVKESTADREKALRMKVEELEAKAAKDREMLLEMTNALKAIKTEKPEQDSGSLGSYRPEEVDLFEELKQMVANEIELRAEIVRLEKKEQAYMQSLEKADEIWAGMESDYKRRLSEAEDANNELQTRIVQLEASQAKLEEILKEQPLPGAVTPQNVESKIKELILENEKLTSEITRSLDQKFEEHKRFLETENSSLREELMKMKSDYLQEEKRYLMLQKELEMATTELQREKQVTEQLRKDLEEKSKGLSPMEEKLQGQISELTQELNRKSKELSNLEVTVAELREEVETLEGRVTELVETIQTTIRNQEEAPPPAKSAVRDQASQWCFPQQKEVYQLFVDIQRPCGQNLADFAPPVETKEVLVKMEENQPAVHVLSPSPFSLHWVVFLCRTYYRQNVILIPPPRSATVILLKLPLMSHERFTLCEPSRRDGDERREDEIFQLCLRNTELQQTLERMEEESRMKDRELEELQKLALEIRRELLFEVKNKSEGDVPSKGSVVEKVDSTLSTRGDQEPHPQSRRSSSIDILQIINPIVVKTTSDDAPTTFSNLQIALDNLQSKCRSKNVLITPLIRELNQKGDNRDFDSVIHQLALEYPSDVGPGKDRPGSPRGSIAEAEDRALTVTEFPKRKPRRSPSAPYPVHLSPAASRHVVFKSHFADPEFSFVAPITTVRKIGADGLFLEWDVSGQPPTVTGFEIKVNGLLSHRVRSATRNKALLHPLNLSERISIQIFALSENNRSVKCSETTFPDERSL